MRKTLMIAACLISLSSSAGMARDDWFGDRDFVGDAPAVKTADRLEWNWTGGHEARIAMPANVRYQAGGTPRVIVTGPADLLAHVVYHDGELRLERDFRPFHIDRDHQLEVLLTGMALDKVAVAGSGAIHMGEIHQARLELSIAGSGLVEASGRAESFELHIAGSGKGNLAKLSARSMDIRIAGSGMLDAATADEANISVAGSGTVHFTSLPKRLNTSIMGSGRISDDEGRVITHNNRRS